MSAEDLWNQTQSQAWPTMVSTCADQQVKRKSSGTSWDTLNRDPTPPSPAVQPSIPWRTWSPDRSEQTLLIWRCSIAHEVHERISFAHLDLQQHARKQLHIHLGFLLLQRHLDNNCPHFLHVANVPCASSWREPPPNELVALNQRTIRCVCFWPQWWTVIVKSVRQFLWEGCVSPRCNTPHSAGAHWVWCSAVSSTWKLQFKTETK